MKNYIYILIIILGPSLLFTGCQDELEKDFINPGVYTPTDNIPAGMFSAMASRTRTFKNDYAEFWWHSNTTGGMIGHTHLTLRHIRDDYNFFTDANDINSWYTPMTLDAYYYGPGIDFRELPLMKDLIDKMNETDKADNQIYFVLSNVMRAHRTAKAVDLFNSIPYSESLQGTSGKFFPKFDDPWEIYKSLIDDLGAYSTQIEEVYNQISESSKRIFDSQDIIFEGDIQKWKQFINALRLRLAVRVSGVQIEYAKTAIQDIIDNGMLPEGDLLIPNNMWVSKDKDHWKRGLCERDYATFIAPTLLNKMDKDFDHLYTPGIDDPRIPVFFIPNRDKLYMPVSLDFSIGQAIFDHVRDDNDEKYNHKSAYLSGDYFNTLEKYLDYNAYSLWNPATFQRNVEPWRAFTKAEVDLLLAEVALKGLANTGKSAADHLKDGVISSINYWYHINSFAGWEKINDSNKNFMTPTVPADNIKQQFADLIAKDYNDASGLESKMGVIIGQKYIHLNIHDYLEVFNELRRTRHPKIPYLKFNVSTDLGAIVERYMYPGNVAATNSENFAEVKDEDNFTSHIFWVPDHLKNETYYKQPSDEDLYINYPGVPESVK